MPGYTGFSAEKRSSEDIQVELVLKNGIWREWPRGETMEMTTWTIVRMQRESPYGDVLTIRKYFPR